VNQWRRWLLALFPDARSDREEDGLYAIRLTRDGPVIARSKHVTHAWRKANFHSEVQAYLQSKEKEKE
jgi:hypothetical protein